MSIDKMKEEQYKKFRVTRRSFLKAGTAFATTAGVFAALNTGQVAQAATSKETDHILSHGIAKGAKIKPAPLNDKWLGTSEIVGPIERYSELEIGFYQAALGKYGEEAKRGVTNFIPKHPLGGAISSMRKYLSLNEAVDGPPADVKLPIPDPEKMSRHIKDTAIFLHADDVGIGVMPEYAYYTAKAPPLPQVLYEGTANLEDMEPVEKHHPYVIGILVDQHLPTMLGSTGYDGISGSMSMNSYLFSGLIACTLAAYIRNLGYEARAHHCGNYQLMIPPVLIAAGLGEMSRTGESVLHPRLGFRHKAAAVTTNLPLKPDGPIDFGLREFCSNCKKCAEECPNEAIGFDRDQGVRNGYKKWLSGKATLF